MVIVLLNANHAIPSMTADRTFAPWTMNPLPMRLLLSLGIVPSMTGDMMPIARMQRRNPAYSFRLFASA